MGNICSPNTNKKPEIISEIDAPFPPVNQPLQTSEDVPNLIKLKNQQHSHAVEDLKNTVGKKLLYGCLIAIAVFALIDAKFHVDSPMFTSAFEVAKSVATTVLGYLFGSKTKS